MNKNKNPYKFFSNYVLRTPLLSFDYYKKLTQDEYVSDEALKECFNDPLIKESCFLASPTLFFELEKWVKGELDTIKEDKVRLSFFKYLTRMCTRCTPFGLFAGCSLGSFDDHTCIRNSSPVQNKRHTRLDMNYLVALSQDISKKKQIREELMFFPNTSIYQTGDQIRYVEYYYINNIRQHHVVEVENSDYLQKIFAKAKVGANIQELTEVLIEEEISREVAEGFIEELLDSQLLISELEPSVSGPEFMSHILEVLKKLKNSNEEVKLLTDIGVRLKDLDKRLCNPPNTYISLSDKIKDNPTPFDIRFLFQTDLELRPEENKLSFSLMKSLKRGMVLMNKLTLQKTDDNLSKFKEAFLERYEEREMQLSKVLDVETGIGYIQGGVIGDFNPLVDDILLPQQDDFYRKTTIVHNKIHQILEEKLIHCEKTNGKKVVLTNNDFDDFPINWDDLPDTLSGMIRIVLEDNCEKILFAGMSGSSAANLLGRFCHGDKKINDYTQKIVDTEAEMNPEKILAEIIHLPEARVGNILMRPSFRDYEIPYLAKSNKDSSNQIPLDDLFISIKNNKLFLRSKKLNKEVIPHLTNAHNYYRSTLPIYQFLCDMQTQNTRKGFYFDLSHMGNNRSFIPRVEFENLILHRAKWRLKKEDISSLLNDNKSDSLKQKILVLRNKFQLPKYALLIEDDKELLINFSNMSSVQVMLDEVKSKPNFVLTEFLFSDETVVKSEMGDYTHQIVISAFNGSKLNTKTD